MDITNGLSHAEQVELFLQAIFVGLDLEMPYSNPEMDITAPIGEGVHDNAAPTQGEGDQLGELGALMHQMDLDDDNAGGNEQEDAGNEDIPIKCPVSKSAISFKLIREIFGLSNDDINTLKVLTTRSPPPSLKHSIYTNTPL